LSVAPPRGPERNERVRKAEGGAERMYPVEPNGWFLRQMVDNILRIVGIISIVVASAFFVLGVVDVNFVTGTVVGVLTTARLPLGGLFILVLVFYPTVAWWLRWKRLQKEVSAEERALALPNGSIRAMLALLTVGSFVLVLASNSDAHFGEVVTAFGTLTGSMIGFYFGTRAAQNKKDLPGGPN